MKLSVFGVDNQRVALEHLANLAEKSVVHPIVRETAIALVQDCPDRDDICEIETIFNAVKYGDPRSRALSRGVGYIADPRWADHFTAPSRLLEQCTRGVCKADCLPGEVLLLTAGYKFTPIADVQVGDVVMGDGKWVPVTAKWDKGVQDILEFDLNNGCVLRCTEDHKLFRVPKRNTYYSGPRENAEEIRASEVRPGDDLLTADKIPFGRESLDIDRAWLLGVHIADGWVGYNDNGAPNNVSISGQDGCRKEEQKRQVVRICEKWGLPTRWNRKYVTIQDGETARWLAACGRGAIQKHVPSLDFDERSVTALQTGLAADADIRNGVFGTISPQLALQYRIIQRMLGRSTHICRVDEHGGFGKNPIYRVSPRSRPDERDDDKNVRPHARVRSIAEGGSAQTFDIEVEGHRFYLPESDLLVHNCDDHSMLLMALLGAIGFRTGARAWGRKKGNYTHVYAVVAHPKRVGKNPSVLGLDTTVKESYVGWEPPDGFTLTAWIE